MPKFLFWFTYTFSGKFPKCLFFFDFPITFLKKLNFFWHNFILCFVKLFTKMTVFSKFIAKFYKFYLTFRQTWNKIYPKLPKDFLYLFSICVFLNFEKIVAAFISESFPEISTNFSENFLKNLVNISIKIYLRIAQILLVVYPKSSENFLFCRISKCKFSLKFHHISTFLQSVNVFKNFLKNLRKFFF